MAVNEKIRFKVKGYDHATVDIAAAKIVDAAKRSGARVSGPIPLPTKKEVVTILRPQTVSTIPFARFKIGHTPQKLPAAPAATFCFNAYLHSKHI